MVTRLKDAFEKASRLTESAQEQLADQLAEEIEGELKWDATLDSSQDVIDRMAKEAPRARREGRTRDVLACVHSKSEQEQTEITEKEEK